MESDAATDLHVDLGLAASVREDIAAEKRASQNRARNRSLTPAPAPARRQLDTPVAPARAPKRRRARSVQARSPHEEALEQGAVLVLSAVTVVGTLVLAGVLGVFTALAATLVV